MRINYFSDVHLEFGPLEVPFTDADVIVAAGDIGVYLDGIEWLKGFSKPVVYVAGNHEFYGREYRSTLASLKAGAVDNIHFLENSSVVLGGTRFLGCTLWTELGGDDNDLFPKLKRAVNDFRHIGYKTGFMEYSIYTEMSRESKDWLIKELKKPFPGPTVVVTHHAPTYWSWNSSPTSLMRYAYCNDLRELFHQHPIDVWFHGHIHSVSDYRCADARILCNPRGYEGKKLVADFDPAKTVEI